MIKTKENIQNKINKLLIIREGIQLTLDDNKVDIFKKGSYVGFSYSNKVRYKLIQRNKVDRKIRKLRKLI